MRIVHGCVLLTWLATLFLCANAQAVVIELTSGRRIVGWLVSNDAQVVRISSTDTTTSSLTSGTIRRINQSEISRLIITVDPQRLEKLSPDNPQAYRNYAEELSVLSDDPEAHGTATRLFAIAAHLAPDQLGGAAMLGLADLEKNRDSQKAAGYHAMAYLLDPQLSKTQRNASTSVTPSNPQVDASAIIRTEAAAWQRFKEALRHFRRGEMKQAYELARVQQVRAMFTRVHGLMSYASFERMCLAADQSSTAPTATTSNTTNIDFPLNQLRLMLTVELATRPNPAQSSTSNSEPANSANLDAGDWAATIVKGGGAPIPVMNLNALTGIDPTHTLFRQGRWQKPTH